MNEFGQDPLQAVFDGVQFGTAVPEEASNQVLAMLSSSMETQQNTEAALAPAMGISASLGAPIVKPAAKTVDTTGGAARVNAGTKDTGARAVTGADGKVTLTNLNDDGTRMIPGAIATGGPSQVTPNTPLSLSNALTQLRGAADPDTARGIMGNLRESAALRATELQTQAFQFAGTKVGVPGLEAQLKQAEAADRMDRSWYPGIGDSPITARIRAQLDTARGQADTEAKRFLETNTNVASLKATLATAEAEMARINRLGERKDALKDNIDLRKQAKLDQQEAEAEAQIGAMTPTVIGRLSVLNPQIAHSDNKELTIARLYKDAAKNKERVAALAASDTELPLLALSGNPDALALTVAEEIKNNPGVNKDMIEARLMRIRETANSPGFAEAAIKFKYAGKNKSPEAQSELLALRTGKMSMDAKDKELNRMQRFNMALEMERRGTTDKFLGDTSNWGINDPVFADAQKKAFEMSGRRDLDSVVTAYLGGLQGPAALVKLNQFNLLIDQAVAKQGKSLFGMPDIKAAKARAIRLVREDPDFLRALKQTDAGVVPFGSQYWGGPGNLFDSVAPATQPEGSF